MFKLLTVLQKNLVWVIPFIMVPVFAFFTGKLFFAGELEKYGLWAVGLFLIGVLPTSGMTISWTGFAGGNKEAAIKFVFGFTMERAVKIVELCKAEYAKDVLLTNPEVSTLMPCARGVYEGDDGKIYISGMNMGLMGKMSGGNIAKVMGGSVSKDEARMLERAIYKGIWHACCFVILPSKLGKYLQYSLCFTQSSRPSPEGRFFRAGAF